MSSSNFHLLLDNVSILLFLSVVRSFLLTWTATKDVFTIYVHTMDHFFAAFQREIISYSEFGCFRLFIFAYIADLVTWSKSISEYYKKYFMSLKQHLSYYRRQWWILDAVQSIFFFFKIWTWIHWKMQYKYF